MMKYIIFEDFSGKEVPFIFPERVEHVDMREQLPYTKPLSAGYIQLSSKGISCQGADASIGLKSRPQDAACITQYLTKLSEQKTE